LKITGAVLAFGVGHITLPWSKWGGLFLGVVSLIQAILLYLMSQTHNLYIAYATYIGYRMLYQVVITIARYNEHYYFSTLQVLLPFLYESPQLILLLFHLFVSSEVAQRISEDSYGLIFGINTFLALLVQTILTLIVADDVGLSLDERSQFVVYGGYHGALAGIFLVITIVQSLRSR
jgi:thiamine transporter 2/3